VDDDANARCGEGSAAVGDAVRLWSSLRRHSCGVDAAVGSAVAARPVAAAAAASATAPSVSERRCNDARCDGGGEDGDNTAGGG